MRLIAHLTCFFLASSLCDTVHAQSANNPLRSFFETRLSDKPDAKAPSYEKLLEVIDSIKSADPNAIQGALPAIKLAAQSIHPIWSLRQCLHFTQFRADLMRDNYSSEAYSC